MQEFRDVLDDLDDAVVMVKKGLKNRLDMFKKKAAFFEHQSKMHLEEIAGLKTNVDGLNKTCLELARQLTEANKKADNWKAEVLLMRPVFNNIAQNEIPVKECVFCKHVKRAGTGCHYIDCGHFVCGPCWKEMHIKLTPDGVKCPVDKTEIFPDNICGCCGKLLSFTLLFLLHAFFLGFSSLLT